MTEKIIIGKTYKNCRSGYKLITPISYNSAENTYRCRIEDSWSIYYADLTTIDILGGGSDLNG